MKYKEHTIKRDSAGNYRVTTPKGVEWADPAANIATAKKWVDAALNEARGITEAILRGAKEAREKVLAEYQHTNGRITSPGKFEGEPIFAPHFWSQGIEGLADEDDGHVYKFKFKNEDADMQAWPELKAWLGRRRILSMSEDGSGFVHCW